MKEAKDSRGRGRKEPKTDNRGEREGGESEGGRREGLREERGRKKRK